MDMMQDSTSRSLAAVSALMAFRQNSCYSEPEPRECNSTPVLDLCTRPKKHPEGARYEEEFHHNNNNNQHHLKLEDNTPTTTTQYMMTSDAMNQDSDSSMSSDNSRESKLRVGSSNFSSPLNVRLKPTRPFKAFPSDPLALTYGVSSSADSSIEAYREFRRHMLEQMGKRNDGITNKNMRRISLPGNISDDPAKNAAYWEKRKKNNEAAKRSRDARRAKEDEIAIRAAYLEHENLKLKYELAALKEETARLRAIAFPKI